MNHASQSAHGWWVATYVERFEYDHEDKANLNRRCKAWENTIIVRATERDEAYQKAESFGRGAGDSEMVDEAGRTGRWIFEGLISLLPIYEELADGAEIVWSEHQGISVKRVKSWVKVKEELEAFRPDDNTK
jgi:Domain of unknown function (DUF4288)